MDTTSTSSPATTKAAAPQVLGDSIANLDWFCRHCNYPNFHIALTCTRCRAAKPGKEVFAQDDCKSGNQQALQAQPTPEVDKQSSRTVETGPSYTATKHEDVEQKPKAVGLVATSKLLTSDLNQDTHASEGRERLGDPHDPDLSPEERHRIRGPSNSGFTNERMGKLTQTQGEERDVEGSSDNANDMTKEEQDFDKMFEKWERDFALWKLQNENNPDKVSIPIIQDLMGIRTT